MAVDVRVVEWKGDALLLSICNHAADRSRLLKFQSRALNPLSENKFRALFLERIQQK